MRLKSIKSKEHTNVEANVQQCSNNHHFSRTPIPKILDLPMEGL